MKNNGVIDIKEEVGNLFRREDTIGFFDFNFIIKGKESISGLCKMARPKKETSNLNYLSVMFIIDTPDVHAWNYVNNSIKEFNEANLKKFLPQIMFVVSIPSINVGQENFIKDFEIVFDNHFVPDNNFISTKFLYAVSSVIKIKPEKFIWWDDMVSSDEEMLKSDVNVRDSKISLFHRIKAFLKER